MADIYQRLAKKLDRLPNGFPATASGVELKILRKIFSPEEAGFAVKLRAMPESVDEIASRVHLPVEETRLLLDRMVSKGQIGSFKMRGVQRYMLAPFVVGIYELQLHRIDKELADLFEEYLPSLSKVVGGYRPALARVIPVNTSIDTRADILPYEDLRAKIGEAKSFLINDCICRKEKALQGQPCRHPLETCMQFSLEEDAYERFNYGGRVITKEEALRILDETEREGLVHATYNIRQSSMFVCNCCSCCCGFLRSLNVFHAPYVLTRSNFVAAVDTETCDQCGACSDRCPMGALEHDGTDYNVLADRCIGCGVCSLGCPSESIRLVRRPEAQQTTPPETFIHWSVERISERGGPLTGLAMRLWLWTHAPKS